MNMRNHTSRSDQICVDSQSPEKGAHVRSTAVSGRAES